MDDYNITLPIHSDSEMDENLIQELENTIEIELENSDED